MRFTTQRGEECRPYVADAIVTVGRKHVEGKESSQGTEIGRGEDSR